MSISELADRRIIVADDDPAVLATLTWVLKEQGYTVEGVPGVPELFRRLELAAPDLVLLDMQAPGNGLGVLERIRSEERWRDIPVIMLSASPPENGNGSRLLGATEFIRKPFRVRELTSRVQAGLRTGASLRAMREALRTSEHELHRAREEADHQRKLVGILHEVTGELSPDEIYRILARRVARALSISHCSVILARPGDMVGTVATAFENPTLRNFEIRLERYPEIRTALDDGVAVLIQDVQTHPLYAEVRKSWLAEGRRVPIRSVIALPFTLDRLQAGVFFLRTMHHEAPLTTDDVEFADTVIKAAVAAVRRARILESTKADNARLEALATTDPLTLLLNRRALVDRLAAEMDRARRYATVVTLLMVDIDHFKIINDTHGHLVGDDVLREVATLLQSAARTVDIVARFGGEEFVIALPETNEEGAIAFAERLRERIEAQQFGRGGRAGLRLTTSIGVATFPAPEVESTEDLFAMADRALYRAKADGRNRVCT